MPSGKQGEDPLVSLKSANRWLGNLPIGDAYKCQQAIFAEIKRFNETSTEFTKDRLAIFMLLDEKSRDLQDTLVRQYLRNPRMSRHVESQLWHAIYGQFWEIARGYHTFVLHINHQSGRNHLDGMIPLITLRAIRAFGQLLKWRAVRYLAASEKLWLRLHNLYRIAESEQFHQKPQRVYAEDTTDCNCETAYLHILMLNLADSGTLYPKQIDLLDRWLCGWHDDLHFDPCLDTDKHSFVIDLSADHGPRRVRKLDADKPMRFWDTTRLLENLQALQANLQAGQSPVDLGLTEAARTAESLELLEHLLHQWASLESREQRRAPRVLNKRLLDVTHGLHSIISHLKLGDAPPSDSPYGAGFNYNEADDVQVYGFVTDRTRERTTHLKFPVHGGSSDVERWIMHDESECGYGAVVETRDKDWLRVGALVGIKPHESSDWKVGFVRRLARINSETSSVGIETLPQSPTLAMLYDTATQAYTVDGVGNASSQKPRPGLWLNGSPRTPSLIIDPVDFMSGKVFQIQGTEDLQFITMGHPIEHSEGWIHVTAEPLQT